MTSAYCVKCKRQVTPKNCSMKQSKNNRHMITGSCPTCHKKVNRFVSGKDGAGLLSMLGIKTPLANIPILGDLIF
jgi:RNase P subunit RPR2